MHKLRNDSMRSISDMNHIKNERLLGVIQILTSSLQQMRSFQQSNPHASDRPTVLLEA